MKYYLILLIALLSLEVFKKKKKKSGFEAASLVFLLNETPYPTYIYDKNTNDFELSEVK